MNFQQSNYLTVFKTQNEQIQVLQLPEFSDLNFRNVKIANYGFLKTNAKTKEARKFAERQYNLLTNLQIDSYDNQSLQ